MQISDRILQNPNFVKWFAGSSVVDGAGKPRVLCHGTCSAFARFERTEDIGFHFGRAECANQRLLQMASGEDGEYDEGAAIMPVVLNLRRTLRTPDLHDWNPRSVAGALCELDIITEQEAEETDIIDLEQVRAWLRRSRYDGLVYSNETEGAGDCYVAFDPRAIKSALCNRGDFRGDQIDR